MKLKPQAKLALIVVGGLALVFGLRTLASYGIIPTPGFAKALVPQRAILPDVKDAQVQNVAPVALPQDAPASVQSTLIRGVIWEWNAQLGLLFANGGPQTTAGSLMAKRNVNLLLYRQDITDKMIEDLNACAAEIKGGATQCDTGANFAIIMGDGSGQFAAAINPSLSKLGPQYKVIVIGAAGYSRGEDAFLAPPEVKANPKAAKGLLVEGVLRDGDWNIAMKWAADNGIPNNPDEKTYDPDAINWVNAPDYNTAAADYVAEKPVTLKVVHNGRPTGETKTMKVNAIVTWTPGDVTAVKQKGGLVKVVSSKQYKSQMPAVIIGPKKFFTDNREEISNMLAAMMEGGDQVKAFEKSLRKAAQISSAVYKDEGEEGATNGDFWYNMYKSVPYKDQTTGETVILGGSAVNNLDNNLILFGMKPGLNDNFSSTYRVFAGIVAQQYPQIVKETPIPDVKEVEDKTFVKAAQDILEAANDTGSEAETTSYSAQASADVIGHRAYQIQFATGSAALTDEGKATVQQLKDSIAITSAFVKIDGYTDNTGSDSVNIPLSRARAASVAAYLHELAPKNFPTAGPNKRFSTDGHGSLNPVVPNTTAENKAQNRRVEITLTGN